MSFPHSAYAQNGRTTTAPPDRFTLVNGLPQTIALQYPTGKRVTSRIPGASDQIMYTLADGRRAYFPLEIGAEIDALRLAPGQPFTICKYGPRQWDVQYAQSSDQVAAPPTMSAPTAPRPQAAPHPPQQRMNAQGEDAAAILARMYPPAVEIALKAVETARGRGLMIAPTFEDVRSIATALFIAETGGRK